MPEDSINEITSYTLIPKFSIDKFGSPILYRVFNIDYEIINQKEENNKIDDKEEENNINNIIEAENKIKEFKINVKSFSTKEIVYSFSVRYPLFPEYYDVLGKSPDKIKIIRFPCILLQSESRYYSLKKIIGKKKKREEEIGFAIKFVNALIEERKKVLKGKEKILSCHKNLEIAKNSWNRLVTLKEMLTKINTFTREVLEIKENRISFCKEEIKIYKDEVNKKKKK